MAEREDERPSGDAGHELLDLQKTLYDSANPTRRWLHRTRRDWVMAVIERVARSDGNALEIGPGSGVYLDQLSKKFAHVTATDVEVQFLVNAKKISQNLSNLTVKRDDIGESTLPYQEFDLILCSEVIEHIPASIPVIKNIYGLLRPNGYLVLTTPQKFSFLEMAAKVAFLPLIRSLVKAVYKEPVLEMGHINLMTKKEVTGLLGACGFEIRESHACGLYLPIVAEFGGRPGLRLEKALEESIRKGIFDRVLWTQCYLAQKL